MNLSNDYLLHDLNKQAFDKLDAIERRQKKHMEELAQAAASHYTIMWVVFALVMSLTVVIGVAAGHIIRSCS